MSDVKARFFVASMVVHGLAAIVLGLCFLETRAMVGFCVVTAALIGAASAGTMPGRPVALYAAFGLLVGYSFWLAVSAISQRQFLELIPALLLVGGAYWMLSEPAVPSVAFSAAVGLGCLVLVGISYQRRFEIETSDAESIRRSALTTAVLIAVALVYLGLGYAESVMVRSRKKSRKKRVIRTPSDSPML